MACGDTPQATLASKRTGKTIRDNPREMQIPRGLLYFNQDWEFAGARASSLTKAPATHYGEQVGPPAP